LTAARSVDVDWAGLEIPSVEVIGSSLVATRSDRCWIMFIVIDVPGAVAPVDQVPCAFQK
jgi:hypothetical protein